MRVAIVGSRDWSDLERVRAFVRALADKYPGAIVFSGGARGVDETAEGYAGLLGLAVVSYRPVKVAESLEAEAWTVKIVTNGEAAQRWCREKRSTPAPTFGSFGASAFFRNFWLAEDGEQIVAFQRGKSRGTQNTIDSARALFRPVHVYEEAA
jgi:hypothetical protein